MGRTERSTHLPGVSPEALWRWHLAPGTFERLVPPWHRVDLEAFPSPFAPGGVARLRLRLGPCAWRWDAVLDEVEPPRGFRDVARGGPFAAWTHTHRFEATDVGARLHDRVDWALPAGRLGEAIAGRWAAAEIGSLLAWRHRRTSEDLARHAALPAGRPRRIGITGASGLVGRELTGFLRGAGHEVLPLVRGAARPGAIRWDPAQGPDPADLAGLDAVVHLAGEPIAGRRWTADHKRRIVDSRVGPTARLAEALAACSAPRPALVSASAIGWWGDRHEPVDERSAPGSGFLAETGLAWEAAADAARAAGVRVVHPRIGIVVSGKGGMLGRLLPLARLGLLGPIGGGRQPISWIALDDLVALLATAALDPAWEGPIAAVAPAPTTQGELVHTLGRVLHRPSFLPAPSLAVRALLGESAGPLVLGGAPVHPTRLRALGWRWMRGDLEDALRYETGALGGDDGA